MLPRKRPREQFKIAGEPVTKEDFQSVLGASKVVWRPAQLTPKFLSSWLQHAKNDGESAKVTDGSPISKPIRCLKLRLFPGPALLSRTFYRQDDEPSGQSHGLGCIN